MTTEPRLSPRATVLWTIAENYTDLVDPLNSRAGIHGTGEALALTPATYTSTVREFERLMTTMRDDPRQTPVLVNGIKTSPRSLRWHLLEWHIKALRVLNVPKNAPSKNKRHQPARLQVDELGKPLPLIAVKRHPQASMALAAAATEWQADNWGLTHEPMLPAAMTEPMLVAA